VKRNDRDLLIFKALCALKEYADASHDAPLKPTFGLRFALAYLYDQSNGDASSFTSFWNEVQGEPVGAWSIDQSQYRRATYARTHLQGIMNAVRWNCPGIPDRLISEARMTGKADKVFREAREVMAKRVAEWEAEDRQSVGVPRRHNL